MIVGYARTSTADQVNGYDAQIEELKREGCEKIFGEQVSSVAQRAELERALDFIREGDGQWRMKAIRFYNPVRSEEEWDIPGL